MVSHLKYWLPHRRKMAAVLWVGLLAMHLASHSLAENGFPTGKPVVGKNADGRLEVFQVDSSGELRHRWQREPNGDWSSWSGLGGTFFSDVAVASNSVGQLEVFAVDRGTKKLRHKWQKTPNGHGWSSWATVDNDEVQSPVTAGLDADGRIEIFAVEAAAGAVKYICQTNGHEGWTRWADLGGELEPGLVVAQNRDGRLELFGVGARDGALVHCAQTLAHGQGRWSPWTSLGNTILPGFAVSQNADGRLEVFAVNRTNGSVDRIYQTFADGGIQWSSWLSFGGRLKTGIAAGQNADGRLEVFAVDDRKATLIHRWQLKTAGSDGPDDWSAWYGMGGSLQPYPALGRNADDNLEIFAINKETGSTLDHKRQISANSEWLDWFSMDHSTFQYRSRTWQVDEGLPHNLVQAIAQTRDGWLWVGTLKGLARFDGIQFIPLDAPNLPALKNASITALCAAKEGGLWIGTDGGGLFCLTGGVFAHFGKAEGLAGDNVRVISEGGDGSLWIGTTAGMSRYQDKKFTNYTERQGLSSDVVSYIYEDQRTNLWIATGKGLNRLRAGGIMDSFAMPIGLPNDAVRGICQDKGGRIWIGSNNGLLWYNSYNTANVGTFYAYNTRHGLSDSFVSAICEDKLGNLWVGTYSGLNRFREGRFFNELNNEGMPFDKVNALFEDHEGNLWVGSREGLIRLTPKRFLTYTKQQGLSHNNIMSVMEDRAGSLWVATWGGGLDQMKDEKVAVYNATNGLPTGLVLSTCEGHEGSLWIGADFDGGLTRLKEGKFTYYTWKEGLLKAAVRVLHEDRAGNLWVGTSQGLSCLKDGRFANYTVKDNLAGNVVRAICEDHAGSIWIGTEGGLSCWKQGQFTNFTTREGLSDNRVIALHEDQDQTLWIGTASGGLNRYKNGRFTAYTTKQGLFSDEIFEILEDDHEWLWLSCSKGVFRVYKRDLNELNNGRGGVVSSVAYGKADGMESPLCNGLAKPAGWKTRDGRLLFPTSKGLISVDPNTAKINREPSPVYIEEIMVDKKRFPRDTYLAPRPAEAPTANPVSQLGFDARLRIPPSRGELEFHYTALNFQTPEKSLFKYKLEGFDADWIESGTRRTAYYNNINPGSYRFRVIACNGDGVWNETGASLAIVLRPHVWQTWWFRGLAVLAAIGVVGGAARYTTRKRMQRKLELVEQQHAIEKERARIGKDIHDDLGSSLTRIMMLGERAEEGLGRREEVGMHIRKIVTSARQTVQSLDEIVWAVNPENDTLNSLMEYISHFTDEFFENAEVSCRLELPVDLPASILPADVRHDLFLVVKESLNNILQHSQATEARVKMSLTASGLEVMIGDNGCGFDGGQIGGGRKGHGLENMRKRVAGLGGQLGIASAPGQGTELKFMIKLNLKPAIS